MRWNGTDMEFDQEERDELRKLAGEILAAGGDEYEAIGGPVNVFELLTESGGLKTAIDDFLARDAAEWEAKYGEKDES